MRIGRIKGSSDTPYLPCGPKNSVVVEMISWTVYLASIKDPLYYLDDFFFFIPSAVAPAAEPSLVAVAVLDFLVAHDKVEGPDCQVTFLGVTINRVALVLCMPL